MSKAKDKVYCSQRLHVHKFGDPSVCPKPSKGKGDDNKPYCAKHLAQHIDWSKRKGLELWSVGRNGYSPPYAIQVISYTDKTYVDTYGIRRQRSDSLSDTFESEEQAWICYCNNAHRQLVLAQSVLESASTKYIQALAEASEAGFDDAAVLSLASAMQAAQDGKDYVCVSWASQEAAEAFYNANGLSDTLDEIRRLCGVL